MLFKKLLEKKVLISFILFICSFLSYAQMELIHTGTKDAYENKSYEVVTSLTLTDGFSFSATSNNEFVATTDLLSQPNQGYWNDPSTWSNNEVPDINTKVVIGTSTVSGFDVHSLTNTVKIAGSIRAKGILINGKLEAKKGATNNAWIELETEYIVIDGSNAKLEIGTSVNPYISNEGAVITLIGDDDGENPAGAQMGYNDKVIMAKNNSAIELFGKEYHSWTKLSSTSLAGFNQLSLAESVDWEQGQEIVIASSSVDWNQAESFEIESISPDKTIITLSDALQHDHKAGIENYSDGTRSWTADLRAEVGLLSRNIKIQGDESSDNSGYGGNIMIMMGSNGKANNVELLRMGQRGKMGRYPWHWHLLGNQIYLDHFKNSSIHSSYNRGITIHGTTHVTLDNNVIYGHKGHGVFLEDGSEDYNIITNNLVLSTSKPAESDALLRSDIINELVSRGPASFWIANPNNTITGNVAAGSEGTGFWFAFLPGETGNLGNFDSNIGHSNMSGFDIFDHIVPINLSNPTPHEDLMLNGGWNNSDDHHISNSTWYSNDLAIYSGVGETDNILDPANGNNTRTDNLIFDKNIFVDNKLSFMLASYVTVDNSIVKARSELNLLNSSKTTAYRFYDGAGRIRNCYFEGWDGTSNNILFNNIGGSEKHANHIFSGTTTDNGLPLLVKLPNYDLAPSNPTTSDPANDPRHPRVWSVVIWDEDGSFSNSQNSKSIVGNHSFLLTKQKSGNEDFEESQLVGYENTYISDHRFALAILDHTDIDVEHPQTPDMVISRVDRTGIMQNEHIIYTYGDNAYRDNHQIPVIVDNSSEFEYIYQYIQKPMPYFDNVQLTVDDATEHSINDGDKFLARFKHFGYLPNILVSGLTRFVSYNDLKNSSISGYYVEPSGDQDLLIKIELEEKEQIFDILWSFNFSLNYPFYKIDTDGDYMTDTKELESGRHPFDARDMEMKFESDNDFEGWDDFQNINHPDVSTINTPIVAHGDLIGQSSPTNADAQIDNDNLNFRADRVANIVVNFVATESVNMELFFKTSSENYYDEDKKIRINYTTPGTWQNLDFQVGNDLDWNDLITGLRLDPVNKTNTYFRINWIKANCSSCGDAGASEARIVSEEKTPLILDVKENKDLLVYPNPVRDLVNVNLSNYSEEVTLILYDLKGRIFFQESINPSLKNIQTVDLGPLNDGLYFLNILSDENYEETFTLILEKK